MSKRFFYIMFFILLGGFLGSCSKGPDPRLVLCQDLGRVLLDVGDDGIEWTGHTPVIKGYQDLEMRVSFSLRNEQGETSQGVASCFYPYEQDEIGAETFEMPTAAYSTYPVKMMLNGKTVEKKLLAQKINKVMIMQGKRAIENLQEKLKAVSEVQNQAD